jgi:hypothetical protein
MSNDSEQVVLKDEQLNLSYPDDIQMLTWKPSS